ncbi:unnamed protein product, partial [Didymodactylos carnosus]
MDVKKTTTKTYVYLKLLSRHYNPDGAYDIYVHAATYRDIYGYDDPDDCDDS